MNEFGIVIRQLTLEDVDAYWALRLRAIREHPESFGASYEEEKELSMDAVRARFPSSEDGFALGAFERNELVGMVGLSREKRRKLRHKAMIWGMYVSSEHQGRGIGRRLIAAVQDRARQMDGLEKLILYVVIGNAPAQKLYRSMGFESFGIERNALKLGDVTYDEDLMVYSL
ncbi:GNAT family N-acetyltransferase [Cohnella thailandensis]|uniref:GNAT family N-acetyltransferase n=1 Tax=Cohnella thailandensis TaxID=557557 RepID=UPI001C8863CF|nr:GNAT family N-acetyltransferase [Cohnella thailandensis]MBP1974643.1 RimJ/RimL family protein N-acetyltransferase [Cohnella thailandensis]